LLAVTASRLISLDTRSGIEVLLGTLVLFVPIALSLSVAAMVTGVVLGAILVGLGLAGTANGGRGTLPVSTQAVYDQGFAVGLVLTGGAFALIGEQAAGGVFAAAGLAGLVMAMLTRYSAKPAPQDFLS